MTAGTQRLSAGWLVALGLLLAPVVPAAAAQTTPPDVLVKNVTQEVIGIISRDRDIRAGNTQKVIDLVEQKVLPHFNFEDMTALAVGRNWRSASATQKKELIAEFKTLLVRTYASALAAYRDERFEFIPLQADPDATDVTVRVRVMRPGRQAVSIDYAMEKMPGGWQVYDVLVDGVSLIANYRTEFADQVRAGGIDGLIKALRAKNEQLEHQARAQADKR